MGKDSLLMPHEIKKTRSIATKLNSARNQYCCRRRYRCRRKADKNQPIYRTFQGLQRKSHRPRRGTGRQRKRPRRLERSAMKRFGSLR